MSVESVKAHTNMDNDLGAQQKRCVLWEEWIVISRFVVYDGRIERIDLATYVTKVHLPFPSHIRLELHG